MAEFTWFLRASDYESVPAGTTIFSAGDSGDVMYGVKEGRVEVCVGDRVLDTVGPGGIFGEMALIDSSERSATARAATDCQIVPVDQKRFTFLVQQTPFFALQMMRVIAQRLRRANPSET